VNALNSRLVRWPAMAVVVLVALFQTVWHLGRANINPDEGVYLTAGRQYLQGIFTYNTEHPPTAKYIYGLVQLLLPGPELTLGRLAAASISFLAGIVIFWWLKRELGWWWAFLAAAFWWLLPRAVADTGVKLDRFSVLEPFMVSFAIMAIALGWWWFRKQHWWLAALSGAVMGLSVTSKVSTAFLVVTFLFLAIRALVRDRRVGRFVVACIVYVASFALVFVGSYWPMGLVKSVTFMIEFQGANDKAGHEVLIQGKAVLHPPWWANLWFTEQGIGPWLLLALCVAAFFAFVPKISDLSAYIGVAGVVLLIFYCGIAHVALPSYYYVWVWALFVLAVIGLKNLWEFRIRRARRAAQAASGAPTTTRWIARPLVVVILVVALVNAVTTTAAIAEVRPTGFARAETVLREHHASGTSILATGYATWEFKPYLGALVKVPVPHANGLNYYDGGPFAAIALRTNNRIVFDHRVERFVDTNRSEFDHVLVDNVDLYIPKGGKQIVQVGRTLTLAAPAAG
jgi:hypothetical protein